MRRVIGLLLLSVLLTGCGAAAAETEPEAAPAFNATDVMYAQMGMEHIRQGDQVVALAEERASDPEVKALATELRGQWRAEAETMRGWLTEWQQPETAPADAGAHEGHGDLHTLREADIAELEAAEGEDFDRIALSLLIGHIHNTVETARMETAGGQHSDVINQANATIKTRQGQVQKMLTLAA